MSRWIIVTEADARYGPLIDGLVASIREHSAGQHAAIGIFDLGLEQSQRDRFLDDGIVVLEPGWNFDLGHLKTPPKAHLKWLTSLPFLPRYFPGFDIYVHIDSDCWVQDWSAVELLLASASETGFAVVPEIDRCYSAIIGNMSIVEHNYRCLRYCFDETSTRRLQHYPMVNSGVFAGRADAPHWILWSDLLGQIMASADEAYFYSEQVALHAVVWGGLAATALLPAWCNWMCYRALPMCSEDGSVLTEPQPPFRPLGIIHLAGRLHKNGRWPLVGRDGLQHDRSLRYRGHVEGGDAPELKVVYPDDLVWGNLATSDRRVARSPDLRGAGESPPGRAPL
jgi:hypothetical protein